ncbi:MULTISPECIES: GDCCVxC domain-containing (seleno)protein [Thalassolituus]|uniref:GDCCVxC domain-containing (seleno)protein n=1 Tax=Thalassolituus TaxID=187492 RepID=UPI0023F45ED3|nr:MULTISPECIES: GDCCVxC domain-containing (seleno)protein [Thalassolituus]
MPEVILQSELTCPECGHKKTESMPTDACQWFYECEQCHVLLKPKLGDCCVYCSYGSVPCPPIQFSQGNKDTGTCCGG